MKSNPLEIFYAQSYFTSFDLSEVSGAHTNRLGHVFLAEIPHEAGLSNALTNIRFHSSKIGVDLLNDKALHDRNKSLSDYFRHMVMRGKK